VSAQELLRLLHHRVIDLHHQGKKLVVLVDECHFLSSDSLHMIRTDQQPGGPGAQARHHPAVRGGPLPQAAREPQLRVAARTACTCAATCSPLGAADTVQYVKFRLLMAGRMEDLFDEEALAAMYEITGGICRRINKLGMLLLIEGYLRRQPLIRADLVRSLADRI
jgi:type II secretory pathway predicted ATPase ExeA